ncbi:unnamed protein product [Phytophthora fragariaefolia]|uniref:Unnamed protein product n=1 Tax=Phytophthora fragariaefolia TaxID=1490495 RepID=A0A9W6XYI1_9STRA|nr:unnamed protein product [Phytophthora fragariaefolia]
MDRNGSGEVDFIEFVLAVWNYCSFNHASLVRFAYDLYDVDGSGEIEHDEVVRCVREVWGSAWETSSSAQKIVEKLDSIMANTPNNRLSAALFQVFAIRHPMLLFPAFELQMEIQRKVLGKRFWSRAAEKRHSLNVNVLNWSHVKEVTMLSRQTSSNLLTSIEEDIGRQIQPKVFDTASGWYGRGTGFRPFSHRSRRTFADSSKDDNTNISASKTPRDGTKTSPELRRTMTPARTGKRRQSESAVPRSAAATKQTSKPMDAKLIKVASPSRSSQNTPAHIKEESETPGLAERSQEHY